MGDTTTVPHNVHVQLNVGGVHLHTSLNTVLEGARLGCHYFQILCLKILQDARDSSTEPVWNRRLVPIEMEQYHVEHFIDADPTHFPLWLGYFRTRKVPYVEAGPRRQRLIAESEEAGLNDLADELRRLVDWTREELQRLLVHRGAVLHRARLQGQDLSRLSFRGADLSGADLRNTTWQQALLNGADLSSADLRDADLSGADLSGANLSNAKLQGARLPWSSGLMEVVEIAGAEPPDKNLSNAPLMIAGAEGVNWSGARFGGTKWVPADKDLHDVKLKGADLSECDLSGVNLSASDLSCSVLIKANLSEANLRSANLTNAQLQGADLSSSDLSGVNLSSADLRGANLSNANMKSVNLTNAKLHDARLPAWSSGLLKGVKLAGAEGWVPADKDFSKAKLQGASMEDAKLEGADMSDCDMSGANLRRADLRKANLSNAMLKDAILPAWNSGLLEGVRLTGATGWPADRDLYNAKLQGADLSGSALSGVSLSSADLRGSNLSNANLKGAHLSKAQLQGADLSSCDLSGVNLTSADLRGTKLHGARLPAWSSGLLEGVKLAGAEGWVPADKDLSNAKLNGADLSSCDLSGINVSSADLFEAKLQGAVLKVADLSKANLWRAVLEGADLSNAKLKGAHLSQAKLQGAVLKGADLSKCDLSGADLTGADLREAKLEGTKLRDATLCAAILHAATGARPESVSVPGSRQVGGNWGFGDTLRRDLKVGQPVVFAVAASYALTLQCVTFCNQYGDGENSTHCAKEMEVQTGPSATGPWTSVVKFTSQQTKQEQTFAAAPDAPLLFGFAKVLVHDTYGGDAYVTSMRLEGEGWG